MLNVLKEFDVILVVIVYIVKEEDLMLSKLIENDSCWVVGNGEEVMFFIMIVLFDVILVNYLCGVVVVCNYW